MAHIGLPQRVALAVGADQVLFIPAAKAPHKLGQVQTPGHHRAAMLALALSDSPWARISTLELERARHVAEAPSYTVDTLAALNDMLPGRRLRLLMGSDQLMIFQSWKDWRQVVALAEPAVMVRPPHTRDQVLAQLPPGLDRNEWAPRLVEVPAMDISSTEIRRKVAAGEDVRGWVDPGVAAYIQEHGLYR